MPGVFSECGMAGVVYKMGWGKINNSCCLLIFYNATHYAFGLNNVVSQIVNTIVKSKWSAFVITVLFLIQTVNNVEIRVCTYMY